MFNYNPFRGLCHEELVLAYVQFSCSHDRAAVALVATAYDEDVWIDLTEFGIGTSDHP